MPWRCHGSSPSTINRREEIHAQPQSALVIRLTPRPRQTRSALTVASPGATVPSFLITTEARVTRDRDFRRPQRRGFDDDSYSPPANFGYAPRASGPRFEAAPAGPPVSAGGEGEKPGKGLRGFESSNGGAGLFPSKGGLRSGAKGRRPRAPARVR